MATVKLYFGGWIAFPMLKLLLDLAKDLICPNGGALQRHDLRTLPLQVERPRVLVNKTLVAKVFADFRSKCPLMESSLRHPTGHEGGGTLLGAVFSLLFFKKRKWPIIMGGGFGIGMAYSNCERDLNSLFGAGRSGEKC